MKVKFIIAVSLLLSVSSLLRGQDLRIMHYNLLNFGNNWGTCNDYNNSYIDKTEYFASIVDHVAPDIITVNEIFEYSTYHEYLLENGLNINGVTHWQKANPPNYAGSSIMNQVFYNSDKVNLQQTINLQTDVRDIDIFRFTCNEHPDQPNLYCVVAHLKAGSDPGDAQERAEETEILMNYLDQNAALLGNKNILFMGDFNLYTSAEEAYLNVLTHSNEDIRFYDPINSPGDWNNAWAFAAIHTQSTHSSSNCAAGGGMDDRFDFILISDEVRDGLDQIKYLEDSYWAVGQDGEHFNSSLTSSPENTSVPPEILEALYNMSDHLPVIMDLQVGNLGIGTLDLYANHITYTNPVQQHLVLNFTQTPKDISSYQIFTPDGRLVKDNSIRDVPDNQLVIHLPELRAGLYFLRLISYTGRSYQVKFIKQ